jgi:hypothetical protein
MRKTSEKHGVSRASFTRCHDLYQTGYVWDKSPQPARGDRRNALTDHLDLITIEKGAVQREDGEGHVQRICRLSCSRLGCT